MYKQNFDSVDETHLYDYLSHCYFNVYYIKKTYFINIVVLSVL